MSKHSHKLRTGVLAKKTITNADLFKLFHELTPSQMSFFRECVTQELGGKPSAFWGHQKIPFKIKHNAKQRDLLYFLEACNHPNHIFARKMSRNKSAAGYGASIAKGFVKAGKVVGKFAVKGAKFMAAHAGTIMKGLDTLVSLGVQGVSMAYQMGALDDESDATLLNLTRAASMAQDIYHAGDEEEETTKTKKDTAEKGGKGIISPHEYRTIRALDATVSPEQQAKNVSWANQKFESVEESRRRLKEKQNEKPTWQETYKKMKTWK